MGWGDFHGAGTEGRVHPLAGQDRNGLAGNGVPQVLAKEVGIAGVVGMHTDGHIARQCLRPSRVHFNGIGAFHQWEGHHVNLAKTNLRGNRRDGPRVYVCGNVPCALGEGGAFNVQ
jgi:hypothetical protein